MGNQNWEDEFEEYFKGNIDRSHTFHCNTKYIKDFIRKVLSEKLATIQGKVSYMIDEDDPMGKSIRNHYNLGIREAKEIIKEEQDLLANK